MPYIIVRYSPNEHHVRNFHRVAEDAYHDTETYIDSNVRWTDREFLSLRTHPSQLKFFRNGSSRLSTPLPPCEVLDELHALGFPVIAANTDLDGVTTTWTLQSVIPLPRIVVGTIMDKKNKAKTYIESSWISDGMNILQSRLGPLERSADENKRDSLFFTQCPPWKVLQELQALGFLVVPRSVGVTPGEWTLEGVSHQIFVRNKMNTESVSILNDDVPRSSREAEEAYRDTKTYIDGSFQRTPASAALMDDLDSQQGLGPLTRYNVGKNRRVVFLSSPRSPDVVGNTLGTLGFSVVAQNTVGVTSVWTLRR